MYNSSSKRRRIKPYARPTSFDYNVRFDIRQYQDVKYNRIKNPHFQMASNDECFRVMEGELLAKNNGEGARYNDKELHVFSFANGLASGLFNEGSNLTEAEQLSVRADILSKIQYMGVAVTEFSPARDVYEQGFVATIAGLNTLYNNSADTIYPGQTLCMDLPKLRASGGNKFKRALQGGVPREKLQFVVRPLDNMKREYGDDLARKFIIGTSISYSRPGDTVDVILHRINYSCGSASSGGSTVMRTTLSAFKLALGENAFQSVLKSAEAMLDAGITDLNGIDSLDDLKDKANNDANSRLKDAVDTLQSINDEVDGSSMGSSVPLITKMKPSASLSETAAVPKKKRGKK